MSGRLGMTGNSVARGDKLVGRVQAGYEPVVKKAPLRLKPLTTSQKVMWGGAAATTAAGAAATSRLRHDKDRRGAAAAGAVTGAAGTKLGLDTSGYALREGLKHHERRVDAGDAKHPLTRNQRRSIAREHRAKHGITTGTMHGAPMKAWRDYPTKLPGGAMSRVMGYKNTPVVAGGILAAGTAAGAARGARKERLKKVDTTMSDAEAKRLAGQYDTKGPLPKHLDRETKMKAYEARYIASGGRQGEKWKKRADAGEVQRNVGLATATTLGAASLVARHPKIKLRHPKAYKRLEVGSLAGAVHGGAAELYSEHARSRRASYQNSPAGVAGSALSRMRAYTPDGKKS